MPPPHRRADCVHPVRHRRRRCRASGRCWGSPATFMVLEAVGGWLSGSLALLADAGHMLTDVGALALQPAHRLDRPAARRRHQDLRLPPLGDPGRAGERRGAVRHRRLGRGRGDPADPAPRADPDRALPGRRRGGAGRQPGQPGDAARLARGQPQRPRRLPPRPGRRPGLGRGARRPPAIIWLTGWTVADPIVSIAPLAAHPGRRLAAAPGEHRHPARCRSPPRRPWPRSSARILACPAWPRCTTSTSGRW